METTTRRGIPITTVPRVLVDLAAGLSEDDLARACHEAGVRYRTTPRQVEAVLARQPNAEGAATLRKVLIGDVHVTLSKLEHASSRCCARPACRCRSPTGRPVAVASTAAGPTSA